MVTQAGHVISFYNVIVGRYTPVVITIAQLIGTFISIFLLRKFEWKNITIIGGFILSICCAALGVFFYEYLVNKWEYSMILSMVFVSIFMLTFGLTFGSSIWPYITFLLPSRIVQGALVINWLGAGLTIISFSFCTYYMDSPYVMFFVYCGVTFILTVINLFLMIPIKGLTFKKVQLKMQ